MTQQQLSASQKLLLTLTKVEAKINRLEREPIAIIGMGCRFPGGANNLTQFWELLSQGRDAVTEVASSRWNIEEYYDPEPMAGKTYVKEAAFLQHPIETFDPAVFGLPPIEAQYLDARHRLLLEVTWEALEDAGLLPTQLPTMTGVFMGIIEVESGFRQTHDELYVTTGGMTSIATGRLSFMLGLQGPNMAIDTACSSSLVALHLACQSLRLGECELALSGGVQDLLSLEGAIALSGLQALAPDGRCKTFSAQANGYGRGEGCGVVVLKRLSDALKDGDRVWAVIKGSAINHDGPSSGLTVPNKVAQVALIRQALAKAQLEGKAVDYVEAHGTGTKLGDPIELRALHEAIGPHDKPLWVGSVKTNLGHLEAAAGIAGVIKIALALYHQAIPPHLHFTEPSPHIDWANLPFQVPTALTPWPRGEKLRVAGVSSFGLSGTNAHVILGDYQAEAGGRKQEVGGGNQELGSNASTHILTLSGKTEAALRDQVANYVAYLQGQDVPNLADICYTSNVGRTHFDHRLAVVADNIDELMRELGVRRQELADKPLTPNAHAKPKIAFLFTGQGPQYADMGRELYETQPLFRQILTECDELLRPYLDISLLELLYGAAKTTHNQLLDLATYAQPALFALEYALAKLWQSWGIEPEVVIGHSMGEYAAACFAGVFSLADGLKLIAIRGRLMQTQAEAGQMVAVLASAEQVAPLIAPFAQDVSIGVINTPQNLVISGRPTGVQAAVAALQAAGLETRPLKIFVASHSPLMESILDVFCAEVEQVTRQRPHLKIVSNVTGELVDEEITTVGYWRHHLRQSVRFAQGMATLAEMGINTFIEVGPKPTLLGMGQQTIDKPNLLWLPSLYLKQMSDTRQMLTSLGQLYEQGVKVDWVKVHAPFSRQKVSLPTYPFQRRRLWPELVSRQHHKTETKHPLIGQKIKLARATDILFQTELSAHEPSYLADHRVLGEVYFPATGYVETVLATGHQLISNSLIIIQNISWQAPLVLTDKPIVTQLVYTPTPHGYQWQLFSEQAEGWQLHATGEIVTSHEQSIIDPPVLLELQNQCSQKLSVQEHYQNLVEQGLEYGLAFQGIGQLYRGEGEALGLIRLPEAVSSKTYYLHPALLDSCLQVGAAILPREATYLPFAIEQFRLIQPVQGLNSLWSYAKQRPATETGQSVHLDLTLFSETGEIVAEMIGLTLRPATTQRLRTDWLYELEWQTAPLPSQSPFEGQTGAWVIIAPSDYKASSLIIAHLAQHLRAKGERVEVIKETSQVLETLAPRGVIYVAGETDGDLPEAVLHLTGQALSLIQQLLPLTPKPNLWFILSEEVGERSQELKTTPSSLLTPTSLWGLGRTLMGEHPELKGRCLSINQDTTAETLFEAIWYADNENQIRLQSHQREVARLVRRQVDSKPQPVELSSTASYLITGGLGGLGLKVAGWLAEHGARHLVLSGRQGAQTAETKHALSLLEGLGVQVTVIKADVSQEAEVSQLIAACQAVAPLRGIIHAAGILDDGILLQQTPERLAKVFGPKVAGSWYLHQHTLDIPLDFLVCFSSAASLLGNVGQGNYAAANAFMDGLMAYRRGRGLVGQSINWGGWAEVGLAKDLKNIGDLIPVQQGLALLGYVMSQPVTQIGVLPTRWHKLPATAQSPLLSQLLQAETTAKTKGNIRQQFNQTLPDQRTEFLQNYLQTELEFILGAKPTADQSLFDLGMDSLMSIQLGNRLAANLEITLPATLTLQYPTLDRLTAYLLTLLGQTQADPEEAAKVIKPVSRDQNLPLSFVQQKVWARQQINVKANLFNIWIGAELDGALQLDWLTQSLQFVAQRQETLRTTYRLHDGVVVPQITPTASGYFTLIDLSHLVGEAQDNEAKRLTFEAAQGVFDVGQETWRVVLLKLNDEKYIFILAMHHLIMDAWSIALLFNEISICYQTLSQGAALTTAPLPPLEVQYADFAYWQRHYFTSERMASRLRYWQERLDRKTPLLELPIDKPRPPAGQMFPSNVKRFRLPVTLSQQLKALSLQTGHTFFVTMLSTYMLFLHQLTGSSEIVTISPMNKRDRRMLEPLIGHFSEMAILWIDLRGQPTFAELQQRVSNMVLEAINQQDVPLEQVVQTLLAGDNLTKDLPYRVLFNLIPPPGKVMKFPDIQAKAIEIDEGQQVKMLMDLSLVVWEENEGEAMNLAGWWRYRTDLFEAETIDRFAGEYETLLTKLVEGKW